MQAFINFFTDLVIFETLDLDIERLNKESLEHLLDARLIQTLSLLIVALTLPGFLSVYQVGTEAGFNPIILTILTSLCTLLAIVALRKRMAAKVYVYSLFVVIATLAISGFAAFGTFSGMSLIVGFYPLMAFFLAPTKTAFAFTLMFFCGISFVSAGYATGVIDPVIEGLSYPIDYMEWARTDFAIFATSVIFAVAGANIRKAMVNVSSSYISLNQRIHEANEALLDFLNTSENPIYRINSSNRILFANASFGRLVKLPMERIIGSDIGEFSVSPSIRKAHQQELLDKNCDRLSTDGIQMEIRNSSGEIKTVYEKLLCWKDSDGSNFGFQGVVYDRTSELLSKAALLEKEMQISRILGNGRILIFQCDREGVIRNLSGRVDAIFGYSNQELIGKNLGVLFKDQKSYDAFMESSQSPKGSNHFDIRLSNKNQETVYASISVSLRMETGNSDYSLEGIIHDDSERAQAILQIREQERESFNIFKLMNDVFYRVDEADKFTLVSPSVGKVLGYSESELFQLSVMDLFPESEETGNFINAIKSESFAQATLEFDVRNRGKRWMSVSGQRIINQNGEYAGFEGFIRDIDKEFRSQEFRRDRQRFESLGRLSGGIAHDFNNLLAVIAAKAELCRLLIEESSEVQENLLDIEAAVKRGSNLTNQLLSFSTTRYLEPIAIDVNNLLSTNAGIFNRGFGGIVSFIYSLGEFDNLIFADPDRLNASLFDLFIAAKASMPKGGEVYVSTRLVDADYVKSAYHGTPDDKNYVEIQVKDTGEGLDTIHLQSSLEPYYTSGQDELNSGFGLSAVYSFVTQSRGFMHIDSRAGEGTTVSLCFPVIADESAAPEQEARSMGDVKPRKWSPRILYVEDNRELRELTCAYLKNLGYEITQFGTAVEAVLHITNGAEFDLLITDIILPGGVDGIDLANKAKSIAPRSKVIFVTGHSNKQLKTNDSLSSDQAILFKPYVLSRLATTIDTLGDTASA